MTPPTPSITLIAKKVTKQSILSDDLWVIFALILKVNFSKKILIFYKDQVILMSTKAVNTKYPL